MTRRTLRHRLAAVFSGTILATMMLVAGGATTHAAGPGTFIDMGGYWKDPACGTDAMLFKARVWKDIDYQGESWVFCSNWSDLCFIPHGQDSSAALLCAQGFDGTTANDYGSSIKISAIHGGASCSLRLYDDRFYNGAQWVQWDPINDADLRPWPNDAWSSIRRVC